MDPKKPEPRKRLPLTKEEEAALKELKRIVEGKPQPATVIPFKKR